MSPERIIILAMLFTILWMILNQITLQSRIDLISAKKQDKPPREFRYLCLEEGLKVTRVRLELKGNYQRLSPDGVKDVRHIDCLVCEADGEEEPKQERILNEA